MLDISKLQKLVSENAQAEFLISPVRKEMDKKDMVFLTIDRDAVLDLIYVKSGEPVPFKVFSGELFYIPFKHSVKLSSIIDFVNKNSTALAVVAQSIVTYRVCDNLFAKYTVSVDVSLSQAMLGQAMNKLNSQESNFIYVMSETEMKEYIEYRGIDLQGMSYSTINFSTFKNFCESWIDSDGFVLFKDRLMWVNIESFEVFFIEAMHHKLSKL